jgi:hypothetical protein
MFFLTHTFDDEADSYKAQEKELEDLLSEGWVWLLENIHGQYRITLDADEGDDFFAWIISIEQNRSLRRI